VSLSYHAALVLSSTLCKKIMKLGILSRKLVFPLRPVLPGLRLLGGWITIGKKAPGRAPEARCCKHDGYPCGGGRPGGAHRRPVRRPGGQVGGGAGGERPRRADQLLPPGGEL